MNIFLATAFCKSQPYSTLELAERALAFTLKDHIEMIVNYDPTFERRYLEALAREDYDDALYIWNQGIRRHWLNNGLYMASIVECSIDVHFTRLNEHDYNNTTLKERIHHYVERGLKGNQALQDLEYI